jgi:ABC-type uncharacterized transport system substrate-binding protein
MSRLLVVAILLAQTPAPIGEALIVVSDQSVFQTAAAGARRTLPNARTIAADALTAEETQAASVVVAIGPLAIRALSKQELPASVPVVACLAPAARGLPSSSIVIPLYPSTKDVLTTVREIVPRAKRIGIFRTSTHPFSRSDAEALGFAVVEPDGSLAVLSAIDSVVAKTDVIWVVDPSVFGRETVALEYLVKSAVARGVPVVGANRAMVEGGALMALVPDPERVGAAAGTLASALQRDSPLPETPSTTQVLVGDRALKRYALTVPSRLEGRVTRVK